MAVSATLMRPHRTARASCARGGLTLAAALGGAEAAYRLAGQFWGAAAFAMIFLATVHVAVLAGRRGRGARGTAADPALTGLIVAASLVPLERLLVLSAPMLPFLRLYPNALWVLPLGIAAVYAYRPGSACLPPSAFPTPARTCSSTPTQQSGQGQCCSGWPAGLRS